MSFKGDQYCNSVSNWLEILFKVWLKNWLLQKHFSSILPDKLNNKKERKRFTCDWILTSQDRWNVQDAAASATEDRNSNSGPRP